MPLRVNNNIAAINARRRLNANNRDLNLRLERLSSGLRVNRAADDAAGLSVREGMRAEISGLKMNVLNAEQGSNLLQVAEGSLNEINAMLIRMRELAVQSANSTLNDNNRESTQAEYAQIIEEIDRIAQSTTYNDTVLLTGFGNNVDTASTALTASDTSGVTNIKISGASTGTYNFVDTAADSQITLGNGVVTQTIAIGTLLDGSVVATGSTVVANFDRLGVQVTLAGAGVANATGDYTDGDLTGQTIIINSGTGGSFQVGPDDGINNRIETTMEDMRATGAFLNLDTTAVATQGSARSSISDADIANEVTAFTRAQILSQAATAMLAQANVIPQTALSLLQ